MRTSVLAASLCSLIALVTFSAGSGRAADASFTPIPPLAGQPAQPLSLQIVKYDGATHGELSVRIKNTSGAAQTLDARGLYFVPQVPADTAPQRLGAVGPLQAKRATGLERMETLTVAAGATVDVVLDVFCIDSHRPSPTSETPFRLATDRLPVDLTRKIDADAKAAAKKSGGYAAPAAKASVQGEVWKNRDQDWVKLDGEGAQEQNK